MDRLENKIDKMQDALVRIEVTMERNTLSLEEHMRRTNILEGELKAQKEKTEKQLLPLQDQAKLIKWSVRIVSVGAAVLVFLKSMGWLPFIK